MITLIEPYEEMYDNEYYSEIRKEMDLAYRINRIKLDMRKVSFPSDAKTLEDLIKDDDFKPQLGKFKAYRIGSELQGLKTFDNFKEQRQLQESLEKNKINKINYDTIRGNYYHSDNLGLYAAESEERNH